MHKIFWLFLKMEMGMAEKMLHLCGIIIVPWITGMTILLWGDKFGSSLWLCALCFSSLRKWTLLVCLSSERHFTYKFFSRTVGNVRVAIFWAFWVNLQEDFVVLLDKVWNLKNACNWKRYECISGVLSNFDHFVL